ncbi:MAG: Fe-S cluster assembly ATPase SufC [bacterium]
MLEIKDLKVNAGRKEILKGFNLEIKNGEIHTIMGPNGSGKTTLALGLIGYPKFEITNGEIIFADKKINDLKAEERTALGLFLSWQNPPAIPGVTYEKFLRLAYNHLHKDKPLGALEFRNYMQAEVKKIGLDESMMKRSVNEGFSGGERKKAEILQLAILKPKLAILDETDSGLDIDALKKVCQQIKKVKAENNLTLLIITHYQHILKYLQPDQVHIMSDGVIKKSGGDELIKEISTNGYQEFE